MPLFFRVVTIEGTYNKDAITTKDEKRVLGMGFLEKIVKPGDYVVVTVLQRIEDK